MWLKYPPKVPLGPFIITVLPFDIFWNVDNLIAENGLQPPSRGGKERAFGTPGNSAPSVNFIMSQNTCDLNGT